MVKNSNVVILQSSEVSTKTWQVLVLSVSTLHTFLVSTIMLSSHGHLFTLLVDVCLHSHGLLVKKMESGHVTITQMELRRISRFRELNSSSTLMLLDKLMKIASNGTILNQL